MNLFYVSDALSIQPFHFPEQIEMGKTISVICTVMSGKSPFTFKWYKNGKILNSETIINTQKKVSYLVIDPVEKSSAGNYTCVVSNADGKDSYSDILTVKGEIVLMSVMYAKEFYVSLIFYK